MKRVLVLDDEPVVRALVCATLEADEIEVDAHAEAGSAFSAIETMPPDLVLVDVGLPGIDGCEVVRRLRANPRTAAIPVLLLTGLEPPQATDADGLIVKPFTLEALRGAVGRRLRI